MRNRALQTHLFIVAFLLFFFHGAAAQPAGQSSPDENGAIATPTLVREIQFMLLSLGMDPGPLDGNARQLTNRAVRSFQERTGLPRKDIVNGEPVSAAFLEELRRKAAQVLLKGTQPEAPGTAVATPPPSSPPPVPSIAPPPPDRFASCTYLPDDFRIGGRQYTPQSFLDEAFDGVTSGAVANLRRRLEEALQIASKIGGAALQEVERQAHVLSYYECRDRIERASADTR